MSSAQLGTLVGHRGRVLACAFSPDGSRIVSADATGVVKVWDASRGVETLSVQAGKADAAFESCRVSWNGARIETKWSPGETQWWDAVSGAQLPIGGEQSALAVSADGGRMVVAMDGGIVLRDLTTREQTPIAADAGAAERWTFSPDGSRIAARIAGPQPAVALWSGITGSSIATLPGVDGVFAFSPRSDRLVTDGPRLWDSANGRELTAANAAAVAMSACIFSADGVRIAAAFANGRVAVFDSQTGASIFDVDAHAPGPRLGCRFVANGSQLLSWGDRRLKLWDAGNGSLLAVYEGHTRAVNDADSSTDGARFVTASDDESVRVWNATKRPAASGKNPLDGRVVMASFSPSGDKVLLAAGGNVHVWSAATWTEKFVAQVHPDAQAEMRCASFNADGATMMAAANDALVLFDAESGSEISRLKAPKRLSVKDANRVVACALSADGSRLAYADRDNRVILWNPVSRAPVRANLVEGATGSDDIVTLAFSPDSRMLVAATAKEFKLLDAATGEEMARVNVQPGREIVWLSDAGAVRMASADIFGTPVAFYDPLTGVSTDAGDRVHIHAGGGQRKWTVSPDGRVLARWRDGLELIRMDDPATPLVLTGHEGEVSDCVFSPDGEWLATASADKTIKLWRVPEGRVAASFWAESFTSCVWSPDGSTLVAGGNDGGVYALRLEAGDDAPVQLKLCGGTYAGVE